MKKNGVITCLGLSALIFTACGCQSTSTKSEEVKNGVTISENDTTGSTVTFTYNNPNATNVQLIGGFEFAKENDENAYSGGLFSENPQPYTVGPEDWESGTDLWHVNDSSYVMDMTNKNGTWTTSLDLTSGYYMYQYNVSYDNGENWQTLTDPNNIPECNALGCDQTRSQIYVPYNEKLQNPQDNVEYQTPAKEEANRGTALHLTYKGVNEQSMPMMVYLPAHYDETRKEPYKVLYLSHGGLGSESDWIYQGHAGNILDNLAADGKCEEFIIVMMNNAVLQGELMPSFGVNDWDYDAIYKNLTENLMPYMEEHYNISKKAEDRAYAGLSMGAWTTCEMYYRDPSLFGYYGIFSGGAPNSFPKKDDYSEYKKPSIYLAAGWEDIALGIFYHTESDHTLLSIKEKFDEAGIEYNNGQDYYSVQGGHDWFTWPQILNDYISNYLWK